MPELTLSPSQGSLNSATGRTSPEAEPLPAHGTVVELPARVLGVVAVVVGPGLVTLPAGLEKTRVF